MMSTPSRVAFRRPWPGTDRGFWLWLIALILGIKGVGYLLLIGGPARASADSALRLPTHFLPIQFWGGVFVFLCAIAAFCAYCHHGRDFFGFVILAALCWVWAGCYLAAPLFLAGAWSASITGSTTFVLIGVLLFKLARGTGTTGQTAAPGCRP